jgi:hypothetical protein
MLREEATRDRFIIKGFRDFLQKRRNMDAPAKLICVFKTMVNKFLKELLANLKAYNDLILKKSHTHLVVQ